MTATYINDPTNRPIDTVRFEVDDRDTDNAALSDEEIQYLIDSTNHVLLAAAAAADAIGAKYSDSATTKKVGDLSISYGGGGGGGGIAATYQTLAKALRLRAARKAGASLYAGGLSKSEKITVALDTDRVQSEFTVGMDDAVTSDPRTAGY